MIRKDNKTVTRIVNGNKNAVQVWHVVQGTARLIWEAVTHLSAWFRSEGYFRDEPW